MNDEDDTEYEMLMPFIACKSQGGPFDDDAFIAGHEIGVLWIRLAAVKVFEALPITATVRRDLLPQVDLMAMHYELALTENEMDPEIYDAQTIAEWAMITFDYSHATLDGPPT